AREVPAGPLDLDHPRPQVGELPGRERRGDRLLERDDGDPLKRQVIHLAIIPRRAAKRATAPARSALTCVLAKLILGWQLGEGPPWQGPGARTSSGTTARARRGTWTSSTRTPSRG